MALFEHRQVPGAGTATFATRDIPQFTQVMPEKHLVAADDTETFDSAVRIWEKFQAASEEDQAKYRTLFHSSRFLERAREDLAERLELGVEEEWTDDLEDMAVITAIFWTNNFACPRDHFAAVYHANSRLNHSCTNNMLQTMRSDGSQCMTALRVIKAGEELTCPYGAAAPTYTQRQERLEDYGFTCTCPLCEIEKYMEDTPEINIVRGGWTQDRRNLNTMLAWLKVWYSQVQDQTSVEQRREVAEAVGIELAHAAFAVDLGLGVLEHILGETHERTGVARPLIQPTYNNMQCFTNVLADIRVSFSDPRKKTKVRKVSYKGKS